MRTEECLIFYFGRTKSSSSLKGQSQDFSISVLLSSRGPACAKHTTTVEGTAEENISETVHTMKTFLSSENTK